MALSSKKLSRQHSQEALTLEIICESVEINNEPHTLKYSKKQFLGKGGFARVYEFLCLESRKIYAAKVVCKENLIKQRRRQKLMSEIKIHRSLHHQNIVTFDHFFEDSENVYILLELCPNQTMSELLRRRKRLTELEVQCYLLQIISALSYIHGKKVIHRDLKIGNLLISEKMEIKLGDFGLASKLDFEGQKKKTICGTPNYIAPEVLEGKIGHSYEVDIWSLGVIMYTLLVGKPPFETNDVKKTYNLIKMNAYSFPDHISISEEAKSLITQILKTEPTRRPSLTEILDHEFFHMNSSIPKLLPISTLAVPPSEAYIKKYNPVPHYQPEAPASDTVPARSNLLSSRKFANNTEKLGKLATSINSCETSSVWVKKWIDYSSKYGLGYLLSNGDAGVYFNDSTKMILPHNCKTFQYIDRGTNKKDIVLVNSLISYPQELHKKLTLLQNFKSYLEGESLGKEVLTESPTNYVKKWLRTKRAILFRFADKTVQVSFQDQTEVILSNKSKVLTYVNKRKERVTMPINKALETSDGEMAKRIKYTRDILNYMMSGKSAKNPL